MQKFTPFWKKDENNKFFKSEFITNHDIKFKLSSKDFNFYFWVNFWYSCVDTIFNFIVNNLIEKKIQGILNKEKEDVKKFINK